MPWGMSALGINAADIFHETIWSHLSFGQTLRPGPERR